MARRLGVPVTYIVEITTREVTSTLRQILVSNYLSEAIHSLSFRRARRSRFGWELLFGAGLESVDFFPDQKKRHLQRLELHTCETIVVGEVKQPMDSGSRHNLYTRLKRIEEYL